MERKKGKAGEPTVLQIVPELDTGGAERTAVDVAVHLVGAGWRAMVLSEGGRLVDPLVAAGAEHRVFPAASKNPLTILANAVRLRNIIRAEGVDIIHARSRAPAWSALWAARWTGIAFVTTYHGAYNQRGRLKGFYNSVMARGDVVIANSAYTAGLIASRHKQAGDRIRVVYRGTDVADYSPGAVAEDRITALRTAWGVTSRDRVIVQMARLTGWKGQRVLIEALAQIAKRGETGWIAILAGSAQGRNDYVAELETTIAAAGLTGHIRLVGHCSDGPAAMAIADTAVVASTEPEAFGRAAVEAQAAGVPVIVTNLGAVPETVLAPPDTDDANRTGWRVPASNPSALADTLTQVLGLDAETRKSLAARARDHVAASFSLDAMTDATFRHYQRLLKD